MYKHLMVPLDGSLLAETALPAAAYFAEILSANITLLHIVERDAPGEIHGERHLTGTDEARAYLDAAAVRFFPGRSRVECRIETGESSGVARSIEECASSIGADLIVMCTHGRSGLRHLFLGSNAQQVVSCGTIPVLQVRPAEEVGRGFVCRRVLVPLDGKPEHDQGLEISALLAEACGAELHMLMVVPTRQTLRGEPAAAARLSPSAAAALLELTLQGAEEYLRNRMPVLQSRGLHVSGNIRRGDPAETILKVATQVDAGLIVVGTHRKVGTDAFWSGSVAPKVTNRSQVPVLLVPLCGGASES